MLPAKKILYVITKSNLGGAQRYVLELAITMKQQGHTVAVASGGSGILAEKLQSNGVPFHTITSFNRDIALLRDFRACRELYSLIHKEKPDIVHLNSSKAGLLGALAARLAGVPKIIFTAHGWPFFEKRSVLWRAIIWIASYITALCSHEIILVSRHDKDRTHMPGTRHTQHVIYPSLSPCDLQSREAARSKIAEASGHTPPANAAWFVTVGEYVRNKNLLTALKAITPLAKKYPDRFVYFLIGSDGDEKKSLQEYIETHGLTQTVYLVGFIDNIRASLTAFDLFILPSYKEGLPYALLEAGSAALPVITSNVGGIPEVVTHGTEGILINPHTPTDLAAALTQYLDDPNRFTNYGTALQHKVHTQFTHERLIAETVRVYGITLQ